MSFNDSDKQGKDFINKTKGTTCSTRQYESETRSSISSIDSLLPKEMPNLPSENTAKEDHKLSFDELRDKIVKHPDNLKVGDGKFAQRKKEIFIPGKRVSIIKQNDNLKVGDTFHNIVTSMGLPGATITIIFHVFFTFNINTFECCSLNECMYCYLVRRKSKCS